MKVRVNIGGRRITYAIPKKSDHLLKLHRSLFPQELVGDPIVCDVCNAPIEYAYVWILILANPWTCWGTVCEECRQRYHAERPAYVSNLKLFDVPTCPYCGKVLDELRKCPNGCSKPSGSIIMEP